VSVHGQKPSTQYRTAFILLEWFYERQSASDIPRIDRVSCSSTQFLVRVADVDSSPDANEKMLEAGIRRTRSLSSRPATRVIINGTRWITWRIFMAGDPLLTRAALLS